MKSTFSRTASLLCALLLCAGGLTACNSAAADLSYSSVTAAPRASENGSWTYGLKSAYDDAEMASEDFSYDYDLTGAESAPANAQETRKIVRTARVSLQTKRFDDALDAVSAMAEQFGGYIESSDVSGRQYDADYRVRNASFTLRIPADRLDECLDSLCTSDELFNVLNKTMNSSDITDSYYDTKSRLDSLKTQEERLLAMLEGATELEYMLQIEQTLADVRYQIENYYSAMQRYDSQVAMSTLSIELEEVLNYEVQVSTPKSYGERLASAFQSSWRGFVRGAGDFFIDLIFALPAILVVALVIALTVALIRYGVRRSRRKRVERMQRLYAQSAAASPGEETPKPESK